MTNYEKHKTEIEKLTRMGRAVAVDKNTGCIVNCSEISCVDGCLFWSKEEKCDNLAVRWAAYESDRPEQEVTTDEAEKAIMTLKAY